MMNWSVGWLVDSIVMHFFLLYINYDNPTPFKLNEKLDYIASNDSYSIVNAVESHQIDSKAFHYVCVWCVRVNGFDSFNNNLSRFVAYSSGQHIIFFIVTIAILPSPLYCHDNFKLQFLSLLTCCVVCYGFISISFYLSHTFRCNHIIIIEYGILSAHCTL